MSQGQGQTTGFHLACNIVRSMFYEPFASWLPNSTVVATREWINYCVIATLLYFAPGGHLCFPFISCFISDYWVNQQSSCVHTESYLEMYFRRLLCVKKCVKIYFRSLVVYTKKNLCRDLSRDVFHSLVCVQNKVFVEMYFSSLVVVNNKAHIEMCYRGLVRV